MRTQKEILERIKKIEKKDVLGFETTDLVGYLNYENAKPFLKESVKKDGWESGKQEDIKVSMIDYMDFAWEKANNFRGLSAARSLQHYQAWLWIDGSDEALKVVPEDDYEFYGKDELCKICDYLGLDSKTWDDGVRLNDEPE